MGIEVDDWPSLGGSDQVGITCSGGARIASSRQQAGIHVQREASVPEENREYVPAFRQALRSIFPGTIEGQFPSAAKAQLVPNIEIRRSPEYVPVEERDLRVTVPET